jgi:hypothetical protein
MENSDRWGLDMFRIAELTDNRTLTCVTYTIFQVKNAFSIINWDQWFCQNFIISMCGVKFLYAYENLRPVYKKKAFFRKNERFLAFLTVKFSKSTHCPLFNCNERVIKKSFFSY